VVVHNNLFSKASQEGKDQALQQGPRSPRWREEYEEKMEALRKVLIDKLLEITEGQVVAGRKGLHR